MKVIHLGMVDSLHDAYLNTTLQLNLPDSLFLFVHQDAFPLYPSGERASEAVVADVARQTPWLVPAFEQPDRWVSILLNLTGEENTGIVGVAGATSLHPGGAWWNEPHLSGAVVHSPGDEGVTRLNAYGPFGRVAVLDGLFLAARGSVFERLTSGSRPDGFHFYDMEFSIKAHLAGFKNWTIPLLLQHESGGEAIDSASWSDAAAGFAERHKDSLPLAVPFEALQVGRD